MSGLSPAKDFCKDMEFVGPPMQPICNLQPLESSVIQALLLAGWKQRDWLEFKIDNASLSLNANPIRQ